MTEKKAAQASKATKATKPAKTYRRTTLMRRLVLAAMPGIIGVTVLMVMAVITFSNFASRVSTRPPPSSPTTTPCAKGNPGKISWPPKSPTWMS